ncbi:hypothetical protein VTN77DRAFT_3510 [Rasamsonia byssochlamydoides]|uniref:uncharacterized protein n=1 Tax=Rasamsonia byssochlamydoides TaxID=89139 RepID=UPI0037442CC5
MPLQHITDLLEVAADKHATHGVSAYPLGDLSTCHRLTYKELLHSAQRNSELLRRMDGFAEGSIFLLHFDSHLDNIIWLWSALYAGCIPAMSTPFVRSKEHRNQHFLHLRVLFDNAICLTRSTLRDQFPDDDPILRLREVDGIMPTREGGPLDAQADPRRRRWEELVPAGGARFAFLNWIGLDHVGSLIEIHLHAMFIGAEQIHVQPPDVISDPSLFLEMIHRHRAVPWAFDLSCLHYIVSGGEANVVETCDAVSRLLGQHGAPRNVVVPGFGMTETCAGCIYSRSCPEYDLDHQHEFASVGHCVPGIQMRASSLSENGTLARPNEPGNLEVRGPIVFTGYYNNEAATRDAFTSDGWFNTGDIAVIDAAGNLNLAGRTKEVISINGVKYLPHELESAIEDANIDAVTPSYTVCFSRWRAGAQTEQLCVIYLPTYTPDNVEARVKALGAISRMMLLLTGARPLRSPSGPRSAATVHPGQAIPDPDQEGLGQRRAFQNAKRTFPANRIEEMLLEEVQAVFDDVPEEELHVETTFFEMGITSVELLQLKQRIQKKLGLAQEIPMITVMTHPSVRSLAKALQDLETRQVAYDPVVTLQSQGHKMPLWLVHPGVGEVLVFLGLAQFIDGRPIHALRARGFNPGEPYFHDLAECVATYHAAIKRQQPHGPYAIAGYSYGAMLVFEIAKVLGRNGDEVRFLGALNLPPHIKFRMRQLDWTECLVHLAYFLGLIPEEDSSTISPQLWGLCRREAVAHITRIAAPSRIVELSLTADALRNWADLAFELQSMARDYDPSGQVESLDVFYCNPLAIVAASKAEWLTRHLSRWDAFTRSAPRFHEVEGSHYTMLGAEYVRRFQKTFQKAMAARGV